MPAVSPPRGPERAWRAVMEWANSDSDASPPPTLDLELRQLTVNQYSELLGRVTGRGIPLMLIGALLIAFTSGRIAAGGFYLVASGLLVTDLGITFAVMMRNGRPLRGWRQPAVALAVSAVPVAFVWPSGPVQRWAGIHLPAWESILGVACLLVLCYLVVRFYAQLAVVILRLPPPPGGDATSLAWIDSRVEYLESTLRARRIRPSTRRVAVRALGHARMTRFQHPAGGQVADLHRAVAHFTEVAGQTTPGMRDEPGVYHDLANAMYLHAVLELRGEDLEQTRQLLALIRSSSFAEKLPEPERDSVERWAHELTLIRFLTARQLQLPASAQPGADEAACEEALGRLTAMASEAGKPDPFRALILVNLAEFHLLRAAQTSTARSQLDHLDQAAELAGTAVALPAAGPPAILAARTMLAQALTRRVRLRRRGLAPADGIDDDHEAAKRYVLAALADPAIGRRRAVERGPADLIRAVSAASFCLDLELDRRRWQEAIDLGEPALRGLNVLVGSAIFRHDREEAIWVGRGLHDKLGYAIAMLHGDQPRARLDVLNLVESGRAVLLREALGRSELAEQASELARDGHAELAAGISGLLARVAELEAVQLHAHDAAGRAVRRLEDKDGRPLRDAIGAAQADFARLRGQADQALGPRVDASREAFERALATAAAGAPLCYLVHLSPGDDGAGPDLPGLALIVTAAAEREVSIEFVSLPALTGAAVRDWLGAWDPGAERGGAMLSDDLDRLSGLFRELGEKIMEPVFAAAGRPDRLVLLPDGQLSMLPLHAATVDAPGGGQAARTGPGRSLCSVAVTSYAPTALILRACRARAAELGARAGGLPGRFVGVADQGGGPAEQLHGTTPELAAASRHFASRELITGDARRDKVLAAVAVGPDARSVSVVHFACHARAEIGDPLSSLISLGSGADDQLKLSDLLGAGLGDTRLAVLSACQTGVLGADDPDEFVSLAAGFVQIGAAGVISTMSLASDPVALVLITRFYAEWAGRPDDPAAALSAAQAWLATAKPSVIAAELSGAYPEFAARPRAVAQLAHPAFWAPFFFLGA